MLTLEPITVTVKTAAKISGLSLSTLWPHITAGRIASTKVGNRRLVYLASLREFLNVNQHRAV